MADRFDIAVSGSFPKDRQANLRRLYEQQKRKEQLTVRLSRESGNPHDPCAIAVYLGSLGRGLTHIGYIPRALAAELAPQIDAGAAVVITRVRINRNWSGGYPIHEVKLTLTTQEPQRRPAHAEVNEVGF